MNKVILLLLSSLVFTSCAGLSVSPYRVNALEKIKHLKSQKLKAGDITFSGENGAQNTTGLSCRLMNFSLPNNQNLESYLRIGLNSELKLIDAYSESGDSVDMLVQKFNARTSSNPEWQISIDYLIDGKKVSSETTQSFNWSYMAMTVCADAANNLGDAVRKNIHNAFDKK